MGIERYEPDVGKKSIEILAIRSRGRSRGVVADEYLVKVIAGNFPPPDRLAGLPIKRQGEEFVALHSGQINPVLHNNWGGPAHWHFDAPDKILFRSKFGRKSSRVRYPRSIRPAAT